LVGTITNTRRREMKTATAYDFETITEAQDWAHRTSLIFDTDAECQAECERLLTTVTIRERDE